MEKIRVDWRSNSSYHDGEENYTEELTEKELESVINFIESKWEYEKEINRTLGYIRYTYPIYNGEGFVEVTIPH